MEQKLKNIWNLAVNNLNEDTKRIKRDYGVDINDRRIYFEIVSTNEIFYYSQEYQIHGLICAKERPENTTKKNIKVLNTFKEFLDEIKIIAENASNVR